MSSRPKVVDLYHDNAYRQAVASARNKSFCPNLIGLYTGTLKLFFLWLALTYIGQL